MVETRSITWNRARGLFVALVASALVLSSLSLAPGSTSGTAGAERVFSVIVQSATGTADVAAKAVRAVGGVVTRDLDIVGGVAANVTRSMMRSLRSLPVIRHVSRDATIQFNGNGKNGADYPKPKRIQQVVRADKLWNEGVRGNGVTVALLDTGVYSAHPDLQGPNGSRVIACEDLTAERGTPAECQDTFGHGTFMAGLIAGNGASSNGKYSGSAPDVNLASIKASGFDGSTDISTILAGIQWAVAHKNVYNIKVLNLSLGSDSGQDYRLSPLDFAVERAWQAGIVVVVSSGNSGPDGMTVMKPGDDPYVITVGASNDEGTINVADDQVPVFSSRGPTKANGFAKPDVVSPGVHTISLRSPGSAIDQNYGADAAIGTHYFRGSGTSMSTATVSGVVAQILEANPGLNPNQVKHRLLSTARQIADTNPMNAGKGIIDAYAAARSTSTEEANQGLSPATGLGSIAADRGTLALELEVVTPVGQVAMNGEFVAQTDASQISLSNPGGLIPWTNTSLVGTFGWDPESWQGTSWKGTSWKGTSWKGTSWKATVWDGTSWKGTSWKNADWEGTSWKNVDWDGTSWKGTSWKSAWYGVAWD